MTGSQIPFSALTSDGTVGVKTPQGQWFRVPAAVLADGFSGLPAMGPYPGTASAPPLTVSGAGTSRTLAPGDTPGYVAATMPSGAITLVDSFGLVLSGAAIDLSKWGAESGVLTDPFTIDYSLNGGTDWTNVTSVKSNLELLALAAATGGSAVIQTGTVATLSVTIRVLAPLLLLAESPQIRMRTTDTWSATSLTAGVSIRSVPARFNTP